MSLRKEVGISKETHSQLKPVKNRASYIAIMHHPVTIAAAASMNTSVIVIMMTIQLQIAILHSKYGEIWCKDTAINCHNFLRDCLQKGSALI